MSEQTILDMCCGSRMFWLDKADPRASSAIFALKSTYCAMNAA